MDGAEDHFAKLVAQRLEELRTNAFAVERAAGMPSDAVRSILRGGKKSGTTLNRAKQVCDALGLEIYIGPKRDLPAVQAESPGAQEFAAIPRYDVELSAGPGAENAAEDIRERLAFRRDWLARLGVAPTRACLVKVRGDSMEPLLHAGDLALIDTSRQAVRNGHAYALLDIDGQTRIKRLDRIDAETLVLRSDNPAYPAELRRGEDIARIKVLGQVVWSGHSWV